MNGAGVDCHWDYVDVHEGRCAGSSLVGANGEDRSWLYMEGLKYQKELHS